MSNHFSIIIQDENGVKQFNLHQIIKKLFFGGFFFLVFIMILGVGMILYLNHSVDEIEEKLAEKRNELSQVSDSLSEIEMLIGLSPPDDMTLQERVSIAKLSSEHMATLMQFIPSGSPIEYNGINSNFGYRVDPVSNKREFHLGLDLKAKMNVPVYATADGIAEVAKFDGKSGYGNLVVLQHNYGFKTYYGHLNKITVQAGKFLKKGDLIGYSGNTGLVSGPHLHYEVRFIQRVLDPVEFVKWGVQNYTDIFDKENGVPWQSLIAATAHIKVPVPTQKQPVLKLSQN
jgi:murein DD-endopeptidase MepM/ murein hydrolase activator NlpD